MRKPRKPSILIRDLAFAGRFFWAAHKLFFARARVVLPVVLLASALVAAAGTTLAPLFGADLAVWVQAGLRWLAWTWIACVIFRGLKIRARDRGHSVWLAGRVLMMVGFAALVLFSGLLVAVHPLSGQVVPEFPLAYPPAWAAFPDDLAGRPDALVWAYWGARIAGAAAFLLVLPWAPGLVTFARRGGRNWRRAFAKSSRGAHANWPGLLLAGMFVTVPVHIVMGMITYGIVEGGLGGVSGFADARIAAYQLLSLFEELLAGAMVACLLVRAVDYPKGMRKEVEPK